MDEGRSRGHGSRRAGELGDNPARPWVIVIEATVPNSQILTDHEWRDLLIERGYCHVHFDGLSRYFVHESHAELKSRLAAPANVFDQFVVGRRHFSASMVHADLEKAEQRVRDQAAEVVRLNEELLSTHQRLQGEQKDQELALRHAHEKELIETRWRERQAADEQLRAEAQETKEALRRSFAAEAATAEARIELARMQERAAHLEDKLFRSDSAAQLAQEQLVEAQQVIADAHTYAATAEAERDQAKSEVDRLRAAADEEKAAQESALTQAHEATERLRFEVGREIEHSRAALAKADRLIREAVAGPVGRWQRIGEALGLARSRPAWQALAAWSFPEAGHLRPEPTTPQPINGGPNPIMISAASAEARNPYLRANSLSELLAWHDVDFVRCAYVTVLGRQPDAVGEAYYTDRIRRGHSKMEVLWQIRRSVEAPKHDPGISGLDRALKIAALRRHKLIGGIARIFYGGDGTSSADQNLRQIQNLLAVVHKEQVRQSTILATVSACSEHSSPQSDRVLNRHASHSANLLDATIGVPAPIEASDGMSSRERFALSIIERRRAS